ncbi:hypothetical protein AC579_9381 [Pseudocercospora musae]|uniref:Heterokaryon incompatibility domain-containing protein n=1 Tax=Pseudocercospora musae TaxID=113226 RepID=A0A139IEH9_9PEZI|nr:hypothetical protein AC579_9381 [Pseudocercospora musae]KXT13163.1 hypothetical protein AC579_9381 [Pseudocercospora musae]
MATRQMRLDDKHRTLCKLKILITCEIARLIEHTGIDAMCINQRDLDERTIQVTLMGEIFRPSTGNLIYLGEDEDFVEPAFQSIRN